MPEKLLFLYLLTNESAGLSGCFEIVIEQIVLDTGVQKKKVVEVLKKLEKDEKIIFRDDWMVLLNFQKHQKLNTNMGIAAAKELANAPEWLKTALRRVLFEKSILPEWFPNGSVTVKGREDEVEDEKEPKPKPKPPQTEVGTWLDAIASQVGAKDRNTMADVRKWREVVDQCLKEQRPLPVLLAVIKSELLRLRDTPQYFTPAGVLKQLQLGSVTNRHAEKLPDINDIQKKRDEHRQVKEPPKLKAV